MKLTKKQIKFLDRVCIGKWTLNENGEVDVKGSVDMNSMDLTEIPVKFGKVSGFFMCSKNKLTTLKNLPRECDGFIYCWGNNLKDYFKNIEVDDLSYDIWKKLDFYNLIEEYPSLINISSVLFGRVLIEMYLSHFPQTKIYLK